MSLSDDGTFPQTLRYAKKLSSEVSEIVRLRNQLYAFGNFFSQALILKKLPFSDSLTGFQPQAANSRNDDQGQNIKRKNRIDSYGRLQGGLC